MKIDKLFADFMNNPLIKFSICMAVCIFLVISIYMFVFPTKEGLIGKMKKALLDPIMKPITMIITTIKCTIRLVISIPKCFLYYMLDIFAFIFYLPFSLLFWILGASKSEKQIWKGIDKIDSMIYNQSGYHIFHYTNGVMNKCYRCIPKKAKKFVKQSANDLSNVFKPETSPVDNLRDTKSTPESIGNAIILIFVIIGAMFLVLLMAANLFGVTLFAVSLPIGAIGTLVGSAGFLAKNTFNSAVSLVSPVSTPSINPFKPSTNPN